MLAATSLPRLVVSAFVPLDDLPADADLQGALLRAIERGSGYVSDVIREKPALSGMGTTVTALLFAGSRVVVAQVGDSRAYLYRDNILRQVTHDQTFVQTLLDNGLITQGQAATDPRRSVLLQAVGDHAVEPAISQLEVADGDRFVLCTDGLYRCVTADSIAQALTNGDPAMAADTLISQALTAGGPDNITVLIIEVTDPPADTVEHV